MASLVIGPLDWCNAEDRPGVVRRVRYAVEIGGVRFPKIGWASYRCEQPGDHFIPLNQLTKSIVADWIPAAEIEAIQKASISEIVQTGVPWDA